MPRGNRTGPRGLGPKTGRAAGYCAGYPVPGFMNPIPGFGRGWRSGRGRGFGRGWGRGYGRGWWGPPQYPQTQVPIHPQALPRYSHAYPPVYPPIARPPSPKQEAEALENYRKELEAEKLDIEKEIGEVITRIEELKTKQEEDK